MRSVDSRCMTIIISIGSSVEESKFSWEFTTTKIDIPSTAATIVRTEYHNADNNIHVKSNTME